MAAFLARSNLPKLRVLHRMVSIAHFLLPVSGSAEGTTRYGSGWLAVRSGFAQALSMRFYPPLMSAAIPDT
jgi:hypothetical protein